MQEEKVTSHHAVFIEIAKNSHIKYEYCPEKKALVCDRILHTPFKYPFNYGFLPNTLSEDGDPLDVVVLMDDDLLPGCYIDCRFLGVLETEDCEGKDPKIIMCPSNKIDPTYTSVQNITDVPPFTLEKITYFFSHYKDLEQKSVTIGNMLDKYHAEKIFQESKKRFEQRK
jgi:inorganic pyrophosphatase